MRIQIKHSLLSDSPFSSLNKDLFSPPHSAIKDLVQDIRNGTPTCYLISGYRGSGKSSFTRRLSNQIEIEAKELNNIGNRDDPEKINKEIVFIHVNFSRHQGQTFILRKLIRGLYLQIKDLNSFTALKKKDEKNPINKRTSALLEELYDKTFYDTVRNFSNSKKIEVVKNLKIDLIKFARYLVAPVFLIFSVINLQKKFIPDEELITFFSLIISGTISLHDVIYYTFSRTSSKSDQEDFTRKSMYDDEIADYHFYHLLESLDVENYKIVYVLDELDKVEDNEIDKLLKEIKPYLVSGKASFLAVAGQHLYYKYSQSKSIDDDVLASIFSKFIHIPLFSAEELREMFDRLVQNTGELNGDEKLHLNYYIDYLIFESKKVPRKFISLIRQNLVWEDDLAYIYIEQSQEHLKLFSQILQTIEKIDDEEIQTEGFEPALRDYLIMQLCIKSHKILSFKKGAFTRHQIIEYNGQ